MRITNVTINRWRNFEGASFDIPREARLICLVGENGSGKTGLLEVVAYVAQQFGLSDGANFARAFLTGDEQFDIEATLHVPEVRERLPDFVGASAEMDVALPLWDDTLTVRISQGEGVRWKTGGVPEGLWAGWDLLVSVLRSFNETNYLFLDADRSYPPLGINPNQLGGSLQQDWRSPQQRRSFASQQTRALYEHWPYYLFGYQYRELTTYHRARENWVDGEPEPAYPAVFAGYREDVQRVLPHLRYVRLDDQTGLPVFDSAGVELTFPMLSGGEREVAFLISQVQRFGLRRGLLMLDEPELHLNPDLLRNWLAFLRDSVEEGQFWIASHSLDAAEVAGAEATFVVERDDDRLVRRVVPLRDRPVLSVLSGAVGSPAFSISRLRFVYIEADRNANKSERERFHRAVGDGSASTRFIEGGGGRSVRTKLDAVKALASESEQPIRVGAVLDRDFQQREYRRAAELEGAFVFRVHELENLFLHPPTLTRIMERNARDPADLLERIASAADRFVGKWIVVSAAARENVATPAVMRRAANDLSVEVVAADVEGTMRRLAELHPDWDTTQKQRFTAALVRRARIYQRLRESAGLWRHCLGKEVLGSLSHYLGVATDEDVIGQALSIWEGDEVAAPDDLIRLRAYVAGL